MMNETLHFLEQHGYWVLAAGILGQQACFPVPVNLLLLAAGALAHSRKLNLVEAVAISVLSFVIADLGWYEAGRRYGDHILHLACAISGSPVACVQEVRSAFAAHPNRTLLSSKFVPGLDAISTPLAGATGFSLGWYVALDTIAAAIYAGGYAATGYLFSGELDRVAGYMVRWGRFTALLAGVAFALFLLRRFFKWQRLLRHFHRVRITPRNEQNFEQVP